MLLPPLHDARAAHLPAHRVDAQKQYAVRQALEQAHRGGEAVVRHALEGDAVDVGVQYVRNVQNRVVVQVHHLVKARVHHAAHAQDRA